MSTRASFFQNLRGKARTGIIVEAGALLGVAFVGFMLVSFAMDRTLRLETGFRFALLVLFLVGFLRMLYLRLVTPMRVELTDEELALALERGDHDLHQALISAVQFEHDLARGDTLESPEMKQVVVDSVQRRMPHMQARQALDGPRIRQFTGMLFGAVLVVAGWGILDSGSLMLWAKRNLFMSSAEWPRYTRLKFVMDTEEGRIRHAENDDLTVEVEAAGVIPEQVFLNYRFQGGTSGKELMAMAGEAEQSGPRHFRMTLPAVIEGATIYATGGDGLSEALEILLIKRPMLKDFAVSLHYPPYMKREPASVNDTDGELQVPMGGRLTVAAKSSKRLNRAYLAFGRDFKKDISLDEKKHEMTGGFTPETSGVLTLDVEDRDGLSALKPLKLFLRVVPDNKPSVDFKSQGIGSMITHKAMIPGTLKIRDDYGITEVTAHMRLTGGPDEDKQIKDKDAKWENIDVEGLRKVEEGGKETEYIQPIKFDLLNDKINKNPLNPNAPENRIQPGHLLALRFNAKDNFGPGDPHKGQSEIITYRVVTEGKLMEDLTRRQIEQRRLLVQVLNKEINYKSEIEEMPSPTSNHPKANQARLRFLALARAQRNLGRQVGGVASSYRQILDELLNNRVVKPGIIADQRLVIQNPLENLAKEDFPDTANMVADYTKKGDEDLKKLAITSYDNIIQILKSVLERMKRLESLAGILERLRDIKKSEQDIERHIKDTLKEEAGETGTVRKPDKKTATRPQDGKKPPEKKGKE